MKKKNIKPEEVEVVIPKEVEAINICGDITYVGISIVL